MDQKISKRLGHDDSSGFEFSKELLDSDSTAAINFDRLQKHPRLGYVIIEYLLCEEEQTVTPYTSHPNRYWNKNASKFLALWRAKLDFHAVLYLVNYAKKGTRAEDEVLLIEVLDMDERGIQSDTRKQYSRAEFAKWFRKLNQECLSEGEALLTDIYRHKSTEALGKLTLQGGKHQGETIESVYLKDPTYLQWLRETNYPYSKAALCYLDTINNRNRKSQRSERSTT